MKRNLGTTAVLVLAGALAPACSAEVEAPPKGVTHVDDQLKQDLAKLQGAKILFSHHSVGDNLLSGLKALSAEAGTPVAITEQRPGKNGDPKAKIDDFVARVLQEPKDGPKVAAFKLCYADFNPSTKSEELATAYAEAVAKLKKERPDVTLLHITTPATVFKDSMKIKVKRMMGSEVWEDAAAMRRHAYNQQLREAMKGELLFDLEELESTRPSGQREIHEPGGKPLPSLYVGYAADDGHLNEYGQKVGARAFAHALAGAWEQAQKNAPAPEPEEAAAAID